MADKSDPRHEARIAVLQKLFERHFINKDITQGYDGEYSNDDIVEINEEEFDKELFEKLLQSTIQNFKVSDNVVSKLAPQWPIEMINKVDLQILRMAIVEGFIEKYTPTKVVLNEAIELGKEFGGETSGKFINGVLGNLIENIKIQAELENAKKN